MIPQRIPGYKKMIQLELQKLWSYFETTSRVGGDYILGYMICLTEQIGSHIYQNYCKILYAYVITCFTYSQLVGKHIRPSSSLYLNILLICAKYFCILFCVKYFLWLGNICEAWLFLYYHTILLIMQQNVRYHISDIGALMVYFTYGLGTQGCK